MRSGDYDLSRYVDQEYDRRYGQGGPGREGWGGGPGGEGYGAGHGREGYGREGWGGGPGREGPGREGYGAGHGREGSAPGRYAGRGPRGYQRSDQRILEQVSDHLTDHGDIDASDFEVHVENGVVTFTGTAEDRRQRRMAEDVAESVPGVNYVQNQLRLKGAAGLVERVSDALSSS